MTRGKILDTIVLKRWYCSIRLSPCNVHGIFAQYTDLIVIANRNYCGFPKEMWSNA